MSNDRNRMLRRQAMFWGITALVVLALLYLFAGILLPFVFGMAIAYFLACPLRELQIHGFTFFQTRYLPGYNDQVTTDEEAKRWVAASERHDPVRERRLVQERLRAAQAAGLTVTLGRHVETHLTAP